MTSDPEARISRAAVTDDAANSRLRAQQGSRRRPVVACRPATRRPGGQGESDVSVSAREGLPSREDARSPRHGRRGVQQPVAIDLLAAAGARWTACATAKLSREIIEPCLRPCRRPCCWPGAGRRTIACWANGPCTRPPTASRPTSTTISPAAPRGHRGRPRDLRQARRRPARGRRDPASPQASDVDSYMSRQVRRPDDPNTSKHVQDEIREPDLVEPILAMYEAAAGAPLTGGRTSRSPTARSHRCSTIAT